MIKTIQIGEKDVSFDTSFVWAFIYKSQFHKDPVQTIVPAYERVGETATAEEFANKLYEELGVVEVANIAWSMAKVHDQSIPDPITWVASFGDDFGVADIMIELIPDAINSCFQSKKSSAPIPQKATAKKAAPKKRTTARSV